MVIAATFDSTTCASPPRPRPKGWPRVDNRSGVAGVHWRNTKGAWRARIGVEGGRVELGEFVWFGDAVRARREAEKRFRSV